jgi:histone H3/H4
MTSPSPSPEAVLHLITLHHLAQAGFASTSQAASLTLTSALEQYILLLARTSAERANVAGRNKVGVKDLVRALDDLGVDGVEEVHEFTVGLGKEVEFVGFGNGLKERVGSGIEDIGNGLGDLRLVEEEEVPDGWWDEEEGDEEMDVDEEESKPLVIRHTSPDMSWLPPLPGLEPILQPLETRNPEMLDDAEPNPHVPISAPTQSIANRYLRPIPYSSSQHSQSHTFRDPPFNTYPKPKISIPPTSLPSLIRTYETTAREPSIAPALNALRAQALRILQTQHNNITPIPSFSPPTSLPPPRSTPYIPSHSDTLPSHPIPLNPHPHPSSILNPLLHTINSPNLPPTLRDRLTSIRPPIPQNRDDVPLLYGEPIRGPDTAALGKARGKPEEGKEGWVRYTWDAGAKGMEKWGKGQLPSGRKVVQWGEGDDVPRMPESTVGKVKLKLIPSPGGGVGLLGGTNGLDAGQSTGGLSPGVGVSPGSGGLKLRIGGIPSPSVGQAVPVIGDGRNGSRLDMVAPPTPPESNGGFDFSTPAITSISPVKAPIRLTLKPRISVPHGDKSPSSLPQSQAATNGTYKMNGNGHHDGIGTAMHDQANGNGDVKNGNGDVTGIKQNPSSIPVVRDFGKDPREYT